MQTGPRRRIIANSAADPRPALEGCPLPQFRALLVVSVLAALPALGQDAGGRVARTQAEPDTVALSEAERRTRFPRALARRARGLGVILLREEVAAAKATDIDELFRTHAAIRALIPGRHVMATDATPCGRPMIYVDGKRTPPGAWEANRHRALLAEFVDLPEIEILEVHRSAELVAEPFLRHDIAVAREENESYPTRLGAAPGRPGFRTLDVVPRSCTRVVLIWTPEYEPPSD